MSVFADFSAPVTALSLGTHMGGRHDLTVEFDRVVPTGSSTQYLWIDGPDQEWFIDEISADPAVDSVVALDEIDGRSLIRVHWTEDESPLFHLIREGNGTLVDAEGTSDGWSVSIRFPDQDAVAAFYEAAHELGIVLELRGINDTGFARSRDGYGLTAIQHETLTTALEAGYFDVPRRVTISELSSELGVSDQAVSERLRRGLEQFLAATLADPRDDADDVDADQ